MDQDNSSQHEVFYIISGKAHKNYHAQAYDTIG